MGQRNAKNFVSMYSFFYDFLNSSLINAIGNAMQKSCIKQYITLKIDCRYSLHWNKNCFWVDCLHLWHLLHWGFNKNIGMVMRRIYVSWLIFSMVKSFFKIYFAGTILNIYSIDSVTTTRYIFLLCIYIKLQKNGFIIELICIYYIFRSTFKL